MDAQQRLGIVNRKLRERLRDGVSGVVNQNVDATKTFEGGADDRSRSVGGRHGVVAGARRSTASDDCRDDLVSRSPRGAGTACLGSDVVHYDGASPRSQQEGMRATDPAAGPRDNRNAVVEPQFTGARGTNSF